MVAYLARRGAVSVEMGTRAWASDGRSADIDILTVAAQASESLCIECKGKEPGGVLGIDEVRTWLAKLPIIREFLANHKQPATASSFGLVAPFRQRPWLCWNRRKSTVPE